MLLGDAMGTDVVLGSIWNGRLQAIADKGAPVAIDWTQHMLSIQAYGIFKDAKNLKNAQLYVDYAMQAKAQASRPSDDRIQRSPHPSFGH
jgi:ABC-type Fe3+ transport system substrate-binding protein